ncbi:MAG: oligopeptide transporter, OPT family [Pirellulaceae bacterium]|nr:oligopeptide transporter, OPT family [Pirellulaceae bacterium]
MSQTDHTAPSQEKKRPAEMTIAAVSLGIILSIVMGAANVYLGLKAGMTVSASIPAAVIAMGILRGILGRKSPLESNLVQTAASAGESLAAGIIFTMPALILAGIWSEFDFWITSLIALAGGLFGVLLMIPMRRVFILDNEELKYPEGVACAEVLRAGAGEEQGGDDESSGVLFVVLGIAVGGLFKFAISFLGLLRGAVEGAVATGARVFYFGCDISPALLAVGYIVGLPIAIQIFIGGAIGWLIGIPLLGTIGVEAETPADLAWTLWSTKIRYMGVGAMLVGGVVSIWHVRHGLLAAINEMKLLFTRKQLDVTKQVRTDRNISGAAILILGLICVALIGGIYYVLLGQAIGITILTTVIMIVMSFFFAAVASYIVGLVGNSNSPVSGMTITAVLVTGGLITLFQFGGEAGMIATLGVAGIVCCVACTAGDVCNDLKTGHLVGASPRNQQIMQVVGVLSAAFFMAPVMTVLHQGSLNEGTGGIGGRDLPAPQANLFASLAEGFFGEEALPKDMVAWGVGIGIVLLIADFLLAKMKVNFRLHVMPVAVGIYLPFGLAVPILLGGVVSWLVRRAAQPHEDAAQKRGVLITSGLIAGESLVGVGLGVTAYLKISSLKLLESGSTTLNLIVDTVSVLALLAVAAMVYKLALTVMSNFKA